MLSEDDSGVTRTPSALGDSYFLTPHEAPSGVSRGGHGPFVAVPKCPRGALDEPSPSDKRSSLPQPQGVIFSEQHRRLCPAACDPRLAVQAGVFN